MPVAPTIPSLDLTRLLEAGYLPEVLPPAFSTETYARALAPTAAFPTEFVSDVQKIVPVTSKCVRYNQARVGGTRRQFSIPNPVHFFRLAKCFHSHWAAIFPLASGSSLSLTKPTVSNGKRAFRPSVNFAERPSHRGRIRSTSRLILRADIARFFPTIYTHSIAWAFHGKAFAKKNRFDKTLVGNQLDAAFQAIQDGQTIGIPIGQDVSRVIAEVILTRVEGLMGLKKWPQGMRCIDDYEVGFLDSDSAGEFRHRLEQALAKFELALNSLKTAVLPLPQVLLDRWDSELRSFDFGGAFDTQHEGDGDDSPFQRVAPPDWMLPASRIERLIVFFNKAIELQQQFKGEPVLRFSLVRLSQHKITHASWGVYQDYLFQCALNQPETIRVVISNLLKAEFKDGQKIDRRRLKTALDAIVGSAAKVGHSSDVAWSLWTALLCGIKLSIPASNELEKCEDSIVACLACELASRGLLPKKFDTSGYAALTATPNALYDDHWLFAYESARNSWAGRKPADLARDPCFAYFHAQGVQFFQNDACDLLKKRLVEAAKKTSAMSVESDSEDDSDSEDAFDLWWLRDDSETSPLPF